MPGPKAITAFWHFGIESLRDLPKTVSRAVIRSTKFGPIRSFPGEAGLQTRMAHALRIVIRQR
jgi:hypothetical protein